MRKILYNRLLVLGLILQWITRYWNIKSSVVLISSTLPTSLFKDSSCSQCIALRPFTSGRLLLQLNKTHSNAGHFPFNSYYQYTCILLHYNIWTITHIRGCVGLWLHKCPHTIRVQLNILLWMWCSNDVSTSEDTRHDGNPIVFGIWMYFHPRAYWINYV